MSDTILEVKHLKKYFNTPKGTLHAVDDVSFTLERGKTLGIVGESGCGKSTTASLLMRFCDASAGHIYMEGKDYHSMKPEELRKHIVMVPQQVNLFSGTLRENLLLADPDADDKALMEAVTEAGLLKFVQSLENGLDSDIGNAGASLSGGQRQKMGIARALLSKAEYMIFDEATSSVDMESEREIWSCIDELSQTRTLIIISHRLSTIQNADVIYVLENGQIAQKGIHEELMQKTGLYRQLVEEQAKLEQIGEEEILHA